MGLGLGLGVRVLLLLLLLVLELADLLERLGEGKLRGQVRGQGEGLGFGRGARVEVGASRSGALVYCVAAKMSSNFFLSVASSESGQHDSSW